MRCSCQYTHQEMILFCIAVYLLVLPSDSFSTSKLSIQFSIESQVVPLHSSYSSTNLHRRPSRPLYLFGNKDKGEESSNNDGNGESSPDTAERRSRIPFFGRLSRSRGQEDSSAVEAENAAATGTITATMEKKDDDGSTAAASAASTTAEDPADLAKSLRQQAERARLEAEKMDAELTLMKISKLERQLVSAKAKGDSVEDLQRQLELLQSKLRGEQPPKPTTTTSTATTAATTEAPTATTTTSKPTIRDDGSIDITEEFKEKLGITPETTTTTTTPTAPVDPTQSYEDFLLGWEVTPGVLKKIQAVAVEIDFDTVDDINPRDVWARMEMIKKSDYSFSTKVEPTFTKAQIDETIEKIDTNPSAIKEDLDDVYESFVEMAAGNKTKLAEYVLEYDWYLENAIGDEDQLKETVIKVMEDEEWLQPVLDAINQTTVDRTIESFFPKCTRKENGVEPTEAQVQSLVTDVLPGAKFSSTSKPEKVLGGYVIKGENRNENGDDLIAAIDKGMARSNLADKMTVLYVPDFTFVAALDEAGDGDTFAAGFDAGFGGDFEDAPAILYVMGPDIVRDRQRVLLSFTSAMGLASCWYLSIYPFLLNPTLAKRVEDQVALADASMTYDLNWLTDLSVPLFVAYVGILAVHELAHRVVAGFYEMETTVPTLVPSIITGTTSTVTTFKAPPKNNAAMFDFSIAGPLAGIAASCIALFLGSELTATSDPAFLPSLPVEILRQSSLGGGIIDGILNGVLYVPDGAPMDGILISLHPLAIAGYIGLIGNALALLPVGTTDGGRIAMTLFGRPGKLLIGNLALFGLLFEGFQSDLFLFYFSFVIAFSTGNEIPSRNEADSISFPRVIAATIAYCIAILALVPFQ